MRPFQIRSQQDLPTTGSEMSMGKVLWKVALRREHTAPYSRSSGHCFPRIYFSAVHALSNFCRKPVYCSCWQGILQSLHDAGFVGMQSARVTGSWDFCPGFRRPERLSSVRQGQDRSRELLRGQSWSCNSDAEDTLRLRKQVWELGTSAKESCSKQAEPAWEDACMGCSWWGCRGGDFQAFGFMSHQYTRSYRIEC